MDRPNGLQLPPRARRDWKRKRRKKKKADEEKCAIEKWRVGKEQKAKERRWRRWSLVGWKREGGAKGIEGVMCLRERASEWEWRQWNRAEHLTLVCKSSANNLIIKKLPLDAFMIQSNAATPQWHCSVQRVPYLICTDSTLLVVKF